MTGPGNFWASWRFASRLARREVRRRPGRTALVIVLIALPMAAMTAGSVIARTVTPDTSRWRDGSDLIVEQQQDPLPDIELPKAATVLRFANTWAPIETTDGVALSGVELVGGDGALLDAHPSEVSGDDDIPADGEVWLSSSLADDLNSDVGDRVSLEYPSGTWTVVGVGDYPMWSDRLMVFGELPIEQFTPQRMTRRALVDLPDLDVDAANDAAATIGQKLTDTDATWNGWVEATDSSDTSNGAPLAWGWVAGAIATAAMGIVIAAAFATSARRQITTLGTLAANGVPEKVRARTLSLQGFWTGVAGSTIGIGFALGTLVVGRSLIARLLPEVAAGYRIAVADLVIIAATGVAVATLAAAIPARSAARIPVLTALAGRRPLGTIPRRLVPIGVAVFAGGVFLLVVAASSSDGGNATTAAAVLGGLAVLAGAGCASPLAIDRMSHASATVGGNWRIAGRSLARNRARSAAVVTAIAVTGSVACAGSAVALDLDEPAGTQYLPRDAVVLTVWDDQAPAEDTVDAEPIFDLGPLPTRRVDETLHDEVAAVVPDALWNDLRLVTWDDPPSTLDDAYSDSGPPRFTPQEQIAVADPHVLDLLDLGSQDRAKLERTGALLTQNWITGLDAPTTGPVEVTLRSVDGDITITAAPRENLHLLHTPEAPSDLISGPFSMIITEDAALAAGLDIVTRGAVIRTDHDLSGDERNAINDVLYEEVELANFYVAAEVSAGSPANWNADMEYTSWSPPAWLLQTAIISAALVLTLLVVAIALALAATESRDERDVLVAVGAHPRTIRSMAGAKAVVLSLTGVALAVPTGLVPMAAVLRTQDRVFHMPWLSLIGLILVVPVVAGAAAWTVSTVAQRFRPVRMSTLAVD